MSFDFRSNLVSGNAAKLITFVALLNFIFFSAGATHAQLDPAFGTNGVAATNIQGYPIAGFVLPDGKILVIRGDLNVVEYSPRFIRFNSDGTLDNTYGTNGEVVTAMPFTTPTSGRINSAVRQADGKIVLAGTDGRHGFITRFNENGTLDTSFAAGGVHRPDIGLDYDYIEDLMLLPDGKILANGWASDGPSPGTIVLIRYSADGVLDQTFGNGNAFVRQVDTPGDLKMLRQSSGKLLVFRDGGYGNAYAARFRRFNADGTLDNTFPNVYLSSTTCALALQSDDKLVVAGTVDKTSSLERKHKDISVSRYTVSGTLDTGFGTNGNAVFDINQNLDDMPKELRVMPNGQILIGALTRVPLNRSAAMGYYSSLVRLSADGTAVNGKFFQTQTIQSDYHNERDSLLMIQPDGKILTVYMRQTPSQPFLLLARALGVPLETYRFKGVPFDFDYTAFAPGHSPFSLKADSEPTLFRPSQQRWYSRSVPNGYPFFGLSDDIPVPTDYIGDFGTELAVFRPSNGTWYIAKSQINPATNFIAVQWGLNGDIPQPADYDGDGKSDIAVFRPSDGVWYIRRSSDNSAYILQWGLTGDKPVAGDYDGDGFYDVAVWRPSDGVWYILRSSDGQASFVKFGISGDVPVQEDFDGDGKTDIAVWRPSSGDWYVLKSSDGGFIYFHWGASNDIAAPADYDGDGKSDFAIWRPATGQWYITRSSDNSFTDYSWGLATDIPVQGKN